jgi:hypothetical protein
MGSINGERYYERIVPIIDGYLRLIWQQDSSQLKQDGTPGHTSQLIIRELGERGIFPITWPAFSPDLWQLWLSSSIVFALGLYSRAGCRPCELALWHETSRRVDTLWTVFVWSLYLVFTMVGRCLVYSWQGSCVVSIYMGSNPGLLPISMLSFSSISYQYDLIEHLYIKLSIPFSYSSFISLPLVKLESLTLYYMSKVKH